MSRATPYVEMRENIFLTHCRLGNGDEGLQLEAEGGMNAKNKNKMGLEEQSGCFLMFPTSIGGVYLIV